MNPPQSTPRTSNRSGSRVLGRCFFRPITGSHRTRLAVRKRAAAFAVSVAALLPVSILANTAVNVPNGTTDLNTLTTTTGSDLTFTNTTYNPAAFTAANVLNIGTLDDLDTNTQTLSISGAGAITLNGGSNSVAPSASDLLYVVGGGTLNISNAITLTTTAANGNFDVAGTSSISGLISGTGFGFTKTGAGQLTLNNSETYTGSATVSAGTLVAAHFGTFGGNGQTNTGTLTINGTGTLRVSIDNGLIGANGGSTSIPTVAIDSGGTLTVAAGVTIHLGKLTLTGGNLATVSSTLSGSAATYGSYNLDNNVTAGGVAATSTLSAVGMTLSESGTTNGAGSGFNETLFTVTKGATNGIDLDVTGTFVHPSSGSDGGFLLAGNGVMRLDSANTTTGTAVLRGAYTGVFDLNNALALQYTTVQFNNTTTGTGQVVFDSSAGTAFTIAGLASSSTTSNANAGLVLQAATISASGVATTNGAAINLTIGNNTASTYAVTYSGVLSGTGSLTKTGAGTQTLTGTSIYTGATMINGGTLALGTTKTLSATSGITISSTGMLSLTATNALNTPVAPATTSTTPGVAGTTSTVQVPITLDGGTLLRNGTGVNLGSGTAVGAGALTLTATSTLDFGTTGVGTLNFNSFAPGTFTLNVQDYSRSSALTGAGVDGTDDRLIFNQPLTTAQLADISFSGVGAQQVMLSNGEYEITPLTAVPEPSTWLGGLLSACLLLGCVRRRFQRGS